MRPTAIAEAIRQQGFRRWYERQLYQSHACLAASFLFLILAATLLEMLGDSGSVVEKIGLTVVALGGALLCAWTWRRFLVVFFRAQGLAERARCPNCDAYAKFDVIAPVRLRDSATAVMLQVRCRQCAREWVMG